MSKIGFFDVLNGCAGDMLAGSLIDAELDIKTLEKQLKKLPIENYKIKTEKVKRKTSFGHLIEGTKFIVESNEKWDDRIPYEKILNIIEKSSFSLKTKEKIIKIFEILAESEASVHKEKKEKIHFHQVGQIDAIVEIVSVIIGLELLEIEEVFSSPVGVSNLAPATINILKDVPLVFKDCHFEITTPTGASILKGIANFSSFYSDFYLYKVGYGAGTREEPLPNMVKFLIGTFKKEEEIIILETNIDDMNPILFSNLFEKLFKAGALDVSLFQGIGKKGRPVFKLEIILPDFKLKEISDILFKESTTIGLRFRKERRILLERDIKEIDTSLGKIKVKISHINGKKINISPEYEDCKKISEEKGIPLKRVYEIIYKELRI
ncbi:MAG: nickel pincer cofactor biosynthesis protein LarC [Candidatus Omnitrophica bacterium]|nr:nickel pincer cofactor biosynthesis protein LarC [Candidatus Omnitrophota bacterium]